MRAREFTYPLSEEELQEIDMSPGGLRRQAATINAIVGMEFEMIVPYEGGRGGDDYPEMERDYSHNPRTDSISDIEEFFHDGDYNSRHDVARLVNNLTERYNEWQEEQFQDRWAVDKTEMIYEFVRYELDPDVTAELLGFNADNRPEGFTRAQLATVADMIADNTDNQWHDEAMDYARLSFYENTDMGEWLSEIGLERMSDVENEFDITWPYWEQEENETGDADIRSIALDFMQAMGHSTVAMSESYHGKYYKWDGSSWQYVGEEKPDDCYTVEPDGSLNPDDDEAGLEFVANKKPMNEMIADLAKVKAWADKVGAYTGETAKTGLHMNVSVPGWNEENLGQLDYVKLALLLGDKYVLEQFERSANSYCKSALDIVRDRVKSNPEQAQALLDKMRNHMEAIASKAIHSGNTSKYTSINTKTGYIEFRSPGGDWLGTKFDKIENTLLRFVVALQAAVDPDAYRKEYLSKLRKLLEPVAQESPGLAGRGTQDTVNHFADYVAGKIPKAALRSFVKQAQLERSIKRGEDSGKRYWWRVYKDGKNSTNSATVEVVAANKEEARKKAGAEWGVFSDEYLRRMYAEPTRPYEGGEQPASSNEPPQQQSSGRDYEIYNTRNDDVIEVFYTDSDEDAQQRLASYQRNHPRARVDVRPVPVPGSAGVPPPELNGRPSNPDGNVYIATAQDPDTPLYRFMAADSDDVHTVLNQWRNQYGSNYTYRIDHLQLRGQPGQAQTAEPIGQVRAAGPSQPAWRAPRSGEPQGQETIERLLGMADQTADANYEIIRRDNYQPVFLFIANTPQVASRVLERYLELIGLDQDSEEFGFRERARPGSTLDIQRQRAEQSAQAATQSTQEGSVQWRILVGGEEVHRFWNRINQGEANTAARAWVMDQIRRGLLSPAEGADVEVVPVQSSRNS